METRWNSPTSESLSAFSFFLLTMPTVTAKPRMQTESLAVNGMPSSGSLSSLLLSFVFATSSSILSASFRASGLIWTTEFVCLLTSSIRSRRHWVNRRHFSWFYQHKKRKSELVYKATSGDRFKTGQKKRNNHLQTGLAERSTRRSRSSL